MYYFLYTIIDNLSNKYKWGFINNLKISCKKLKKGTVQVSNKLTIPIKYIQTYSLKIYITLIKITTTKANTQTMQPITPTQQSSSLNSNMLRHSSSQSNIHSSTTYTTTLSRTQQQQQQYQQQQQNLLPSQSQSQSQFNNNINNNNNRMIFTK